MTGSTPTPGLPADDAVMAKAPPGAVQRAKSVRIFNCPACGGQISLKAAGATMTAVCAHCGAVVDVTNDNLSVIQKAHAATMPTTLEIGARGKLAGVTWEVIGYTLKADRTGVYFWDEYLLFNPYHGFRFLVQQDGHWNYVKVIKNDIERSKYFKSPIWFDGRKYQPFLQDDPSVQYVKGEFYWRIKKGDKAHTEDFVCPPYMLSYEIVDGDMTVSLCEYVHGSTIAGAFQLANPLPPVKGVAPNQVNPCRARPVMMVCLFACVAAVAIHLFTAAASPATVVYDTARTHVPGDQSQNFTSPPIDIPQQTNIEVKSWARVDNEWAELGLSLENEATGATHDMRQPIEYYHGYDSDGYWSEGGDFAHDYFSAVPKGSYRLVYDVDSGRLQKGFQVDIGIKLIRGVAPFSNLMITLLLLCVWPCFSLMRSSAFETKRWANSDFPRTDD
jgi:hypothetical protein